MEHKKTDKGNELYSDLACFTFMVFFCRIGEIFTIFAAIHINLLLFGASFVFFFIDRGYKTINWSQNSAAKIIALFLFIGAIIVPFAIWPTNAFERWKEYLMINSLLIQDK